MPAVNYRFVRRVRGERDHFTCPSPVDIAYHVMNFWRAGLSALILSTNIGQETYEGHLRTELRWTYVERALVHVVSLAICHTTIYGGYFIGAGGCNALTRLCGLNQSLIPAGMWFRLWLLIRTQCYQWLGSGSEYFLARLCSACRGLATEWACLPPCISSVLRRPLPRNIAIGSVCPVMLTR